MQKLFDICDICLLLSLMEGISISILEAMASGCFVITTNVGGNPEIIKNNINGCLIKPRNARDILLALDNFDNLSSETRIKIKETARKTIKRCFSEDKMVKSYQDIFSKLIKKYENKQ